MMERLTSVGNNNKHFEPQFKSIHYFWKNYSVRLALIQTFRSTFKYYRHVKKKTHTNADTHTLKLLCKHNFYVQFCVIKIHMYDEVEHILTLKAWCYITK